MRNRCLLITTCLVLSYAGSLPAHKGKAAVARILNVSGKPVVSDSVSGRPRRASIYGGLFEEDEIQLPADSALTLCWNESNRMELVSGPQDRPLRIKDGKLKPEVGTAVALPRKAIANIEDLVGALPPISQGAVVVPRSDGQSPLKPRIIPVVDSRLLSDTPEFAWEQSEGVEQYKAQLFQGDSDKPLWTSDATKNTRLKYDGAKKLRPGIRYRWHVTNPKSKKPVVEGAFTIANERQQQEAQAVQELAPVDMPDKSDVVLLVLAANYYEQNRYFAEAIVCYERLTKAQPESADFWAALAELYARAGQSSDAKKATATAQKLGFEFAKAEELK